MPASMCLFDNKHTKVHYIPTHTGHTPSSNELQFIPLPTSTMNEVALKCRREFLVNEYRRIGSIKTGRSI